MAKKIPKTPNDYPILGYRVLPNIKESLTAQLDEVLELYNRDLGEDQKPFKKNDIFVKALKQGLNAIARNKGG